MSNRFQAFHHSGLVRCSRSRRTSQVSRRRPDSTFGSERLIPSRVPIPMFPRTPGKQAFEVHRDSEKRLIKREALRLRSGAVTNQYKWPPFCDRRFVRQPLRTLGGSHVPDFGASCANPLPSVFRKAEIREASRSRDGRRRIPSRWPPHSGDRLLRHSRPESNFATSWWPPSQLPLRWPF